MARLQERGVDATATRGGNGQFDVVLDGELLFSKHSAGRFPGESEIERLVSDR